LGYLSQPTVGFIYTTFQLANSYPRKESGSYPMFKAFPNREISAERKFYNFCAGVYISPLG
jgi:hypothetical protein